MKLFSLSLISVVCCFISCCYGNNYKVIVRTGCGKIIAGTEGKVYITLYGEKGNSSTIRLDNEGKPGIQRCTTDTFDISTEDIGIVSKIRIEFDGRGLNSDNWLFGSVLLIDETQKRFQYFQPSRWLITNEEQNTKSVEFEVFQSRPTTDYKVTVETGDEEDAGTHAKVYITLNGGKGDSHKILLDHEGKSEFQRGQTDTFYITTGDIGLVPEIQVELDSTAGSQSPNWFLKGVSVEDLKRKLDRSFLWNEWLTPTADQKTISVEIPFFSLTTDYEVRVVTGDEEEAGTHGKVYITIYGEKGHSSRILLDHEGEPEFQRGQTDTFNITTKDIGYASKIRIELETTAESHSPDWFLREVTLEDQTRYNSGWFPWDQWLTPTADQMTISVEIPRSPWPILPAMALKEE